jgi:hypothetical protein
MNVERSFDKNNKKDGIVLGYDVASVINRTPTFRGQVMSSFSRVEMPQKNVICTYTAAEVSIYIKPQ